MVRKLKSAHAAAATPSISQSADLSTDPLFLAMEQFTLLEHAAHTAFKSLKSGMPLDFYLEEQPNGDVEFGITSVSPLDGQALLAGRSSYKPLTKGQERLVGCFWYVKAKQTSSHLFEVGLTRSIQKCTEVTVKGQERERIVPENIDSNMMPSFDELISDFRERALNLLGEDLAAKLMENLNRRPPDLPAGMSLVAH